MISEEVYMDIIAMKRFGYSKRKIARIKSIHRNTVTKHLESNSFPQYKREKRKESILQPYHQIIKDYLDQDNYQAAWIFDRLKKMGYKGSYDTVKIYVREIKEKNTRLAYVRFETEPGLQAQVDWGDFQIQEPDGKKTTIYAFAILLGYSRTLYLEFVNR